MGLFWLIMGGYILCPRRRFRPSFPINLSFVLVYITKCRKLSLIRKYSAQVKALGTRRPHFNCSSDFNDQSDDESRDSWTFWLTFCKRVKIKICTKLIKRLLLRSNLRHMLIVCGFVKKRENSSMAIYPYLFWHALGTFTSKQFIAYAMFFKCLFKEKSICPFRY